MNKSYIAWQQKDLSKSFLEGVRGGIPFATEQLDIMLKIIHAANPNFDSFLDLGCGDGVLGRAILTKYPDAKGVFLDFSETMLEAAKEKIVNDARKVEFISADFGHKEWINAVKDKGLFDAVVSGFAIHHQSDERKREIYREIYQLLKPGGIFLNLEHVASKTKWIEERFEDLFIDSLYSFHQRSNSSKSKAEIAKEFYYRPDKGANILAPVETQCEWLRELGFINVDCYFKIFEIALFGGMRSHG